MHPCTTEDYAKFFPTAAPFRKEIDNLKQQEGLFCLDWQKEGFELFGSNNQKRHSLVDIRAVPCGAWTTEDTKHDFEGCNLDKKSAIDYLDTPEIIVYHNRGQLRTSYFGSETIKRESIVQKIRFDQASPSWSITDINQNTFYDESAFLQLGQYEEFEFFDLEI